MGMQYCTACQKAIASIVIMDVTGGSISSQQHLCGQCAETMGVVQQKPIKLSPEILEDLLGSIPKAGDKPSERPRERTRRETTCPGCGLDLTEFKVKGRFGCPRCYEAFRGDLLPLLHRVHDAVQHKGRMPGSSQPPLPTPQPTGLAELRRRLEDAIRGERYEEAAHLRDELRGHEKGEEQPS